MAKEMKFSELEKITGHFAVDEKKYNPNEKMTQEDFMRLSVDNPGDFVGVSYDDRVQFLKDNGYKVNRENLFADLSAKQKED